MQFSHFISVGLLSLNHINTINSHEFTGGEDISHLHQHH